MNVDETWTVSCKGCLRSVQTRHEHARELAATELRKHADHLDLVEVTVTGWRQLELMLLSAGTISVP